MVAIHEQRRGPVEKMMGIGADLRWRYKKVSPESLAGFQEHPAVPFWSSSLTIATPDIFRFAGALRRSSQLADFTYQGFFTSKDQQITYHFTRFPGLTAEIPTTEACDNAMNVLTQQLRGDVGYLMKTEHTEPHDSDFRVVLGLLEHYGDTKRTHNTREISRSLGREVHVEPAAVFVVGPKYGFASYEEPAAILTGSKAQLPRVYALAKRFNQDHFAVEDLAGGVAYLVQNTGSQKSHEG